MTSPHPSERTGPKRLHVLVSYAYWNSDAHMRVLQDAPSQWNIMLDSGAFTNFTHGRPATTVADYAAFCREHRARWWRMINLDRIGDPVTSARNLQHLHDAGLPALPVFQRGDNPASLLGMADQGFPVCIGGISQNVNSTAERRYLHDILRRVKHWNMKAHLLGVGGHALFKLPCWSGDSSSWEMASRYGTMRLWNRGKLTPFSKSPSGRGGRSYMKPTLERTSALRSYGLTWDDLRVYRKWSLNEDSAVYLASIRSWIRVARALAAVDKRYVFAAPPSHLGILERAWDMEKHSWT